MDFIYFNFDLSIVSLFIGILNDKKNMRVARCFFTYIFYFSHHKIPTLDFMLCPSANVLNYPHHPVQK